MHKSVNEISPNAKTISYRHLSQSEWRKIKMVEVVDFVVKNFISEKLQDARIDRFLEYLVENYDDGNEKITVLGAQFSAEESFYKII